MFKCAGAFLYVDGRVHVCVFVCGRDEDRDGKVGSRCPRG